MIRGQLFCDAEPVLVDHLIHEEYEKIAKHLYQDIALPSTK